MFNFLGIGAQKAGTTWLYAQLKQHPDVWMPIVKELHFFDAVHLKFPTKRVFQRIQRRAGSRIAAILEKTSNSSRSARQWKEIAYLAKLADSRLAYKDKWYQHVFTGAPRSRCKGEITPLYCSIGPEGVEHVKKLNPRVRLIYLIRDPLDRAVSSLRMRAEESKHPMKKIISERLFVARCNYAHDIQCWDDQFGKQILYVPFGHVKSRPDAVMKQVEEHLGIQAFDSYQGLAEQVHGTNKKVVIPDSIVATLQELVAPQYGFLEERFGSEFLQQTK